MRKYLAILLLALPFSANADVITGTISDWPESGPNETFGDGMNSVTMFWSINTFDLGFFYGSGFTDDSDVAIALGITDVTQIVDASLLTYTSSFVGPVCDADCDPLGVGTFLVYNNINTGHYGVFRVDDIVVPDGDFFSATVNGTWWFQTDGTGDFSSFSVPEPGVLPLLAAGLFLGALMRRRVRLS